MIEAVTKYNVDDTAKFTFDKYATANATLDKFNWALCKDKTLLDLASKGDKWTADFWAQKDAVKQVTDNYAANQKAVDEASLACQNNWNSQDIAGAGKNYAKMWALLMGGKHGSKTEEEERTDVIWAWSD